MRQLKITNKITNRDNESLDRYLNEISKLDLIEADEEVRLAKLIKQGDMNALDKLTKANLRFVVSVAKQYQNQGLSLSDLINEGNLGLIKAAQKFDETKGFKFISYAVWWIRQSILQALVEQSRMIRLPVNKVGSSQKLYKVMLQFEQKYQREPTADELAELMEMSKSKVLELIKNDKKHLSVDAPFSSTDSDSGTMLDVIVDTAELEPDHDILKASLKDEVRQILSILSQREQAVIAYYFGLGEGSSMSLEEIGIRLDLTRERVRQIKERALKRIRKASGINSLKSYL